MKPTIDQLLEIADAIIKDRKSRPLRTSEEAALRAAWEGLEYDKYVEKYGLTITGNTLKQSAFLIYPYLREAFQVKRLKKANIKSEFQRQYNAGLLGNYLSVEHRKIITRKFNEPNFNTFTTDKNFIGRSSELNQLIDLSIQKKCIHIWGESGIGKTSLVNELSAKFLKDSYIIVNTKTSKELSLEEWAQKVLLILGVGTVLEPLNSLSNLIIEKPIALIIDNAEYNLNIYEELFAKLISPNIKSIIIIISDIRISYLKDSPITKIFHVDKIKEYEELFISYKLDRSSKWIELYEKYNGNISQIIHAIEIIHKFFDSNIENFLNNNSTVFPKDAYKSIQKKELCELDIYILNILVEQDLMTPGSVFRTIKQEKNNIYSSELIFERFVYLENSSLITQINGKLIISPIARKFILRKHIERH